MKQYILIFCLLAGCLSAMAQTEHEHSACDEDSISSMKEAILSEVTVSDPHRCAPWSRLKQ